MKKQDFQRGRNPVHAIPRSLFYGFAAALLAFFPRLSHGQCPAPLTVTGSTSAGATGTWTAPASGGPWLVEIVATGAGGAGKSGQTGGSGATITARYIIQDGQSLFAIAGGPGASNTGSNGGGGGGASGVVNCGNPSNCSTGTILLIAAGGNGAEGTNNGLGGSILFTGNGSGGASGFTNGGGGGGGLNAAGAAGSSGTLGGGGGQVSKTAIATGGDGTGNSPDPDGGNGMGAGGGGGSSTSNGSGGGGGHTGAPGSNTASATSYLDASGVLQSGTNGAAGGGSNSGSVTITCIGSAQGQCFNGVPYIVSGPATTTITAPSTGGPWLVEISATGAGGGGNTGGDLGGSGATVSGTFTVQNGEILRIIAGGAGKSPTVTDYGGGGGGGSGVVNCGTGGNCATGTILLIAAGGNGAEGNNDGLGGSSVTSGGGGGGGTAGTGGGGGGLNASGTNGSNGFGGSQVSKTGLALGGQGNGSGSDDNDGGNGMGAGGGGGSGGSSGSGGGGGHTGAISGNTASASSFINASGILTSGTNGTTGGGANAGSVTITCVGFQPSGCDGNTTINLSGPGATSWTAPSTGGPWVVRLSAKGGGGGDSEGSNQGGSGATMSGTFTVQNGETLLAIAGDKGGSTSTAGGGGGGGSGVVNCGNPSNCSAGTILIIAAGGNGGENQGDGQGGSITTGGSGTGGGGTGNNTGGAGGGLTSAGSSGTGTGGAGGGQVSKSAIATGGNGSSGATNKGGNGMGAGGGGGTDNNNGSGGGGGHTGANAGRGSVASSFNSGANQLNTAGANGSGSVVGTVTVLCLASLPVELINFKAVLRDHAVELQWSTASEKNNFGFDVERSADNHNWTTLGFAPGHGNTTDRHDYGFVDEKPLAGVNYYRLKQQDYNGKFEYTPIVVADVRSTGGLQFDIYPNPSTTGEFSIRTVSGEEGEALLEIYDWVGYKVYKDKLELLKGTMVFPVSMTTFPKGTYTARLEMPDGTVQFRKIVLQ